MTWGRDTDELEAADQLQAFRDAGGTLVDTAPTYGDGAAEETLGRLLATTVARDELVVCTKAGVRHAPRGVRRDASRGGMLDALDGSLRRLGVDHVDLWLVQAPDLATPIEETLSALHHAVRSGRTRHIGLANYPAWAMAQAATLSAVDGCPIAAGQWEHSLLRRGVEREALPGAAALGVGALAWSPLGRGVLTGKYRRSVPADSRAASPHLRGFVEPLMTAQARTVVEAVVTAAEGLGRLPLEVALAWCRDFPGVDSAIVGARTAAQLRGSLGAEDLTLPEQIRSVLDEITDPGLDYPERA